MFQTYFDEKTKLWTGADVPPLFNPNISIAQVLLRMLKIHGSKIAQVRHFILVFFLNWY